MRVCFTLKIDFGIKATDRETRVRRGAHAARRHASPWLTCHEIRPRVYQNSVLRSRQSHLLEMPPDYIYDG